MSFHFNLQDSLLASKASNEKSANNLTEVLSYVMNHFSLASFRIFPLPIFVFQKFDYHVFRCGSLSTSYLECIELLGCL